MPYVFDFCYGEDDSYLWELVIQASYCKEDERLKFILSMVFKTLEIYFKVFYRCYGFSGEIMEKFDTEGLRATRHCLTSWNPSAILLTSYARCGLCAINIRSQHMHLSSYWHIIQSILWNRMKAAWVGITMEKDATWGPKGRQQRSVTLVITSLVQFATARGYSQCMKSNPFPSSRYRHCVYAHCFFIVISYRWHVITWL